MDKIRITGARTYGYYSYSLRSKLVTEANHIYNPLVKKFILEGFRLAEERQSELLSKAGLTLVDIQPSYPPSNWFGTRKVRWFSDVRNNLPNLVIQEALLAAQENFDQAEYYYLIEQAKKKSIDDVCSLLNKTYDTSSMNFVLSDMRELQKLFDTSGFKPCNPYYLRKNTKRQQVVTGPEWEQFIQLLGELTL